MLKHTNITIRRLLEGRGDKNLRDAERALRASPSKQTWLRALNLYKRAGMVVTVAKYLRGSKWPICPMTDCKHESEAMCYTKKKCYIYNEVTGFCSPWTGNHPSPGEDCVRDIGYKGNYTPCLCPHHENY